MKKLFLFLLALSTVSLTYAQTLDRSVRPKPGPTPDIKLADAQTFTLDNGLKVFVVENHKNPSVTYSIQLDIYPEGEGDKAGLSQLVGSLLTSGTKTRNKDEFNAAVDEIGASLGASGSGIYGIALSKHQDKLLELMSDAVLNANFKKDELEKTQKQIVAGMNSNINDADFMMSNVSRVVTYGPNHPYGEVTTQQTVKNVSLDDCNKYYKTYFRPNVAYMAVVGDITLDQARQLVTKYFGKWQKADVPKTIYPTAYAPPANQVEFVTRPGSVQSVVDITYPLLLKIGSDDVLKARALNTILGGGDQGKLFLNLREKHGWTYGAYSSISPDPVVGSFSADLKCRNEVTDSAIEATLQEMYDIRNNPVSAEELSNTKNYLSGIFALGLESPQTLAQYAINIDRFNMPKDYYKNYLNKIAALTPIDVQLMAKKYIAPKNANIVVVGDQSIISKLKRFSADSNLLFFDAFGKPVQSTESKVINGVTVKDVVKKYIDAIGGEKAIASLKDLTVFADVKGAQSYALTKKVVSPDKYYQEIKVVQHNDMSSTKDNNTDNIGNDLLFSQKTVINGDHGYITQQGKKTTISGDGIKQYQDDADLQSLLHPEQYQISYSLLGVDNVNGTECYQVEKGVGGVKKMIQFYDKATGLLLKEIITTQTAEGQKVDMRDYADYKEVKGGNGYKIPYTITTTIPSPSTITVSSAKANSGIKDREFN